jgi:periplasmic protein CpxP/Spy
MLKSFVTLCFAIILASPAFAQMKNMTMERKGPGAGPGMGMCDMCAMDGKGDLMGGMMGNCLKHADRLGLTDEQVSKIKPIHRDMQKKQAQFMADLKIAQIDMKGIMDVKDFDLDKAIAQVKKIEDIKTAHHIDMLKSMKEVRSIFTEEQFRKMQKMMPMMMEGTRPHKKMMMRKK